jgi:hypothetical protein
MDAYKEDAAVGETEQILGGDYRNNEGKRVRFWTDRMELLERNRGVIAQASADARERLAYDVESSRYLARKNPDLARELAGLLRDPASYGN